MDRAPTLCTICAFAWLLFLQPGIKNCQAELVSFVFTGTVTAAFDNDINTDPDDIFGAVADVGDSLTGQFTIDTSAPVSGSVPGFGGQGTASAYNQNSASAKISVVIDGVAFESDGVFLASVANDYVPFSGTPPSDIFAIGDGVEPGGTDITGETILVDGSVETGRVSLQFNDDSFSAFSADSIPPTLNLADFNQIEGRVNGTNSAGVFGFLTYQVDSLTVVAVPEPAAAMVLFGIALCVLGRRKSLLLID